MPGQHHITYTAIDIERYLKNEMSPSERHQLEKAALDDPFLADAIEGYSAANVAIQPDLDELRERLSVKQEKAKVIALPTQRASGFPWLRAAAMIIVVLVAGWAVYQFAWNDGNDEIAQGPAIKTDTTTPAGNVPSENPEQTEPIIAEEQQSPIITEEKNTTAKKDVPPASSTLSQIEVKQPEKDMPAVHRDEIIQEERKTESNRKQLEQEERAIVSQPDKKEVEGQVTNGTAKTRSEAPAIVNTQPYSRDLDTDHENRMANARVFRGQVTDENNNPLPFVNITSTRDHVGTYTDVRGNFTLVSTDTVLDVQVRSLGYENRRTLLSDEEESNIISLQEDRNIAARVLDTVKRNLSRARGGNRKFEEPEPADGWDYYDTYLVNNLNVPETFLQKRADQSVGEVELSFEVNRHGEPVNIKVEKSLCEQCDKEAIRLIKQGPKWKRKAKKSRTRVMVPFY